MNEFVLIAGMTLVTFAVRYPVLALVGRMQLPDNVLRALRYVPVAVLTAIIIPTMFAPDGGAVDISLNNAYLIAGFVSIGVAWYRKNLLMTIVMGMVVFLAWRAIFGV